MCLHFYCIWHSDEVRLKAEFPEQNTSGRSSSSGALSSHHISGHHLRDYPIIWVEKCVDGQLRVDLRDHLSLYVSTTSSFGKAAFGRVLTSVSDLDIRRRPDSISDGNGVPRFQEDKIFETRPLEHDHLRVGRAGRVGPVLDTHDGAEENRRGLHGGLYHVCCALGRYRARDQHRSDRRLLHSRLNPSSAAHPSKPAETRRENRRQQNRLLSRCWSGINGQLKMSITSVMHLLIRLGTVAAVLGWGDVLQ